MSSSIGIRMDGWWRGILMKRKGGPRGNVVPGEPCLVGLTRISMKT